MKIGIFDSGLGGLFILKSIVKRLPEYDFVYLGDTKRLPYGNRSEETVYGFTCAGVEFLFQQGCWLVILACNTASSSALRKIQRDYLKKYYSKRRVLGVIIPTVETVVKTKPKRVGVLATVSTVESGAYRKEFKKAGPKIKVFQSAAPLLVPLVESSGGRWAGPIIKSYLKPLLAKRVDTVVLGCTHYPILRRQIRKLVGRKVKVVSQDEVIPKKLTEYLDGHPEVKKRLSKGAKRVFYATDLTRDFEDLAKKWFGSRIKLRRAGY